MVLKFDRNINAGLVFELSDQLYDTSDFHMLYITDL